MSAWTFSSLGAWFLVNKCVLDAFIELDLYVASGTDIIHTSKDCTLVTRSQFVSKTVTLTDFANTPLDLLCSLCHVSLPTVGTAKWLVVTIPSNFYGWFKFNPYISSDDGNDAKYRKYFTSIFAPWVVTQTKGQLPSQFFDALKHTQDKLLNDAQPRERGPFNWWLMPPTFDPFSPRASDSNTGAVTLFGELVDLTPISPVFLPKVTSNVFGDHKSGYLLQVPKRFKPYPSTALNLGPADSFTSEQCAQLACLPNLSAVTVPDLRRALCDV